MAVLFITSHMHPKKSSEHTKTSHTDLIRFLRERDEDGIADLFSKMETIRHGRWYGGKGNGNTIKEVLKILNKIEGWKDEY